MSRRTGIVPALVALLATAVGLVIVLARESSALADRYGQLRRFATRAHAGMYVPPHETATITGAPITLADGASALRARRRPYGFRRDRLRASGPHLALASGAPGRRSATLGVRYGDRRPMRASGRPPHERA